MEERHQGKIRRFDATEGKLTAFLESREEKAIQQAEQRKWEIKQELEEAAIAERHERERKLWDEKLLAEQKITERRLQLEKEAKSVNVKLPKLDITPFKGTITDWVRFENTFITQVDKQPIPDEQKFGYLLENVSP